LNAVDIFGITTNQTLDPILSKGKRISIPSMIDDGTVVVTVVAVATDGGVVVEEAVADVVEELFDLVSFVVDDVVVVIIGADDDDVAAVGLSTSLNRTTRYTATGPNSKFARVSPTFSASSLLSNENVIVV
jgi:choline-glycine betaine transporter